MKVIVQNGSTVFRKGAILEVLYIDVEHCGTYKPERSIGKLMDEDDEEELAEIEEQHPFKERQIVRTWFLVATPKNKKFEWIDSARVRYHGK